MAKRVLTEIKVYWDTQDPSSEGWAYVASDDNGLIDSGSVSSDPDDLDDAIQETIFELGLSLSVGDFGKCNDEGGWAHWRAE